MKILIIEDEKVTAIDLKKTILAIEPDAEIVGLIHTVEQGIQFFTHNQNAIDLIFSDIHLGDGLSFEILKKANTYIPIIFCTAHNVYYSEAFQSTGIDYILKPFTKDTIEKALSKYQNIKNKFSNKKGEYENLLQLIEHKIKPKKSAIIMRHQDKIIPIEAHNIAILYVENGYTYAYTFNQNKFMVNENLEELEQAFYPTFFRANRQYLVNRKEIKDAAQHFNRKVVLNLTVPFKEQILIGKLKITPFIEWLSHVYY